MNDKDEFNHRITISYELESDETNNQYPLDDILDKYLLHVSDFLESENETDSNKYKFRSPEEGGRKSGEPCQGIRSDFSIEGEEENTMYMIWPEFEDSKGNVLLDTTNPVSNTGTARMWIINNEMRPYHYEKIKIGVKAHFREGGTFSGDCEVIEILDLKINPITNK